MRPQQQRSDREIVATKVPMIFRHDGGPHSEALTADYGEERVRTVTACRLRRGIEYLVDLFYNSRRTIILARPSDPKSLSVAHQETETCRTITARDIKREKIGEDLTKGANDPDRILYRYSYRGDGACVELAGDLERMPAVDDPLPLYLVGSAWSARWLASRNLKFAKAMADTAASDESIDWFRENPVRPWTPIEPESMRVGVYTAAGRRKDRFINKRAEEVLNLPRISSYEAIRQAEEGLARSLHTTYHEDKLRPLIGRGMSEARVEDILDAVKTNLVVVKWAADGMRKRLERSEALQEVAAAGGRRHLERLGIRLTEDEPTSNVSTEQAPAPKEGTVVQCPNTNCNRKNRVAAGKDLTQAVCSACKTQLVPAITETAAATPEEQPTPPVEPEAKDIDPWAAVLNADPPTGNQSKRSALAATLFVSFGCAPQDHAGNEDATLGKIKAAYKAARQKYSNDVGMPLIKKILALRDEA